MTYFLLIISALLSFKLAWDYYAKNAKKRVINHRISALIDTALYCIAIYFLGISWFYLLFAFTFRWMFFDLFFNLLNKDKWNHYGESSNIDILMKKTGKFHIVIKLLLLLLSIWLIR